MYVFGEFELDAERFTLSKAGRPVSIGARAFDVLAYLVSHRDRPVSKQELVSRVWGLTTLSNSAVPTCIAEVRRALGGPEGSGRLVETIPKRGYRFAGEALHFDRPSSSGTEGAQFSATTSTLFVGRDRELAAIRTALTDCKTGNPRLVLLSGEAGIGKTRTSEEFLHQARSEGCAAFIARCHEGDGAPAFWPWAQIVRSCVERSAPEQLADTFGPILPFLAPLLPASGAAPEATLPSVSADSPQATRFRLFDSVTRLLQRIAIDRPLIMLIDDLHRADSASLQLLQFIIRELRDSRVLILGTYRDEQLHREAGRSESLSALIRDPRARGIPLGEFSIADVTQYLAKADPGEMPSASFAEALHDRSGGNPFFLTQLVQLLMSRDGDGLHSASITSQTSLPLGLRDAIARQMDGLPPPTKRLLASAAVIGREFVLTELAESLDVSIEDLLSDLAPAIERRLVRGIPERPRSYRFNHVLLRDALYEGIESTERSALHRRIGKAIEKLSANDLDARAPELANHFLHAARGGSVDAAIDYTIRAARRATLQLAFEDACQHYRVAINLIQPQSRDDQLHRTELLLALGDVEIRAGERDASRQTLRLAAEQARAISAPELLARVALGLAPGMFAIEAGIVDPLLIGLLEEALTALGETDNALRACVMARLSTALVWTDAKQRRDALSREALEVARRVGDPMTIGLALIARHGELWAPGRIPERIGVLSDLQRSAEEAADESLLHLHRILEIALKFEMGDIRDVDRKIGTFNKLAQLHRNPHALWYADLFRLVRATMDGDPKAADAYAPAILDQGNRIHDSNALHAFGANFLLQRWNEGRAETILESAARMADAFPAVSAWRAALAFSYLEAGRATDARREFERVSARDFEDIPWNEAGTIAFCLLAEVSAELDDKRRSTRLYDILLPAESLFVVVGFASAFWGSVARRLGLLAVTLGRVSDASEHFEYALHQDGRTGALKFVAQTQYDYARLLLRRGEPGDHERANTLLSEAHITATRLDLRRLSDKLVTLRAGQNNGGWKRES